MAIEIESGQLDMAYNIYKNLGAELDKVISVALTNKLSFSL